MDIKKIALGLIGSLTIASISITPGNAENKSSSIQFFCREGYNVNMAKYVPTTFASIPNGRKVALIHWQSEFFQDSGFSPQTRCEKVSPRFQKAYDSGTLRYLTHGILNNQPVICASQNIGGLCQELLFTLQPNEDPEVALKELNQVLQSRASASRPVTRGISLKTYLPFNIEELLSRPSSNENINN